MNVELLRAFVALEIEGDVRERIVSVTSDLRRQIPDARWAPVEQLHLTLRFLGDLPREALAQMEPDLRRAVQDRPAAEARVAGLGIFPERGSPRILWIGIDVPPSILQLQVACEEAAVVAGVPRERRPFRPHLTLARWRGPARRPVLQAVDLGPTRLSRLVLFRSELKPEGAEHTALATFELGSRP